MFTAFQLGITPKRPSSQSALSPNLHFYIFSYLAKVNRMQIEMVLKKMIRDGALHRYMESPYPKKRLVCAQYSICQFKPELFLQAMS